MKVQNEPWQIAAARYCVEHSEQGFEFKELKDFINAKYSVRDRHLEFLFKKKFNNLLAVDLVGMVTMETGCHHLV